MYSGSFEELLDGNVDTDSDEVVRSIRVIDEVS